jgi:hypothetical protein
MSQTMLHFTHYRAVPFQAAHKLERSIVQIAIQASMATKDVEDIVPHRQVMVTDLINLVVESMLWIGVLKEFEYGLSRVGMSPKISLLGIQLQMDGRWFERPLGFC